MYVLPCFLKRNLKIGMCDFKIPRYYLPVPKNVNYLNTLSYQANRTSQSEKCNQRQIIVLKDNQEDLDCISICFYQSLKKNNREN